MAFRFRAPDLPMSPEFRWLFIRAFNPPETNIDFEVDPGRVLESGTKLDLIARIASRIPAPVLIDELGEEIAAVFEEWFEATALRANSLLHVRGPIAEVALELGIQVIFLKGMALHLLGISSPGSRPMGDIDILVPEDSARAFQDRMIELGWKEAPGVPRHRKNAHHLSPLLDAHGRIVEVHFRLKNLRDQQGRSLVSGKLGAQVQSCPGPEASCLLPSKTLLLAHLLAHGTMQHGNGPSGYAPARLLADLVDLSPDQGEWETFFRLGCPWIGHAVQGDEIKALASLSERLAQGEDPALIGGERTDVSRVLGHFNALLQSTNYHNTLRFRRFREGGVIEFLKWCSRRTFVSSAAVRRQIGSSAGFLDLIAWHIRRPFRIAFALGRWAIRTLREKA